MTAADREKQGSVGEHLVCADILQRGYSAFLAVSRSCRYDIVADISSRLLRIQVKTATENKGRCNSRTIPVWDFTVQRRASGQKARPYSPGEYDVLALVALDINKIGYVLPVDNKWMICVRSRQHEHMEGSHFRKGTYIEDLSLDKILATLENL